MVTINGVPMDLDGNTITGYLTGTAYNSRRIAIERNGELVPRAQYETTILKDGDTVEIVSFVGGG